MLLPFTSGVQSGCDRLKYKSRSWFGRANSSVVLTIKSCQSFNGLGVDSSLRRYFASDQALCYLINDTLGDRAINPEELNRNHQNAEVQQMKVQNDNERI